MNSQQLQQLYPGFENELCNELLSSGSIKEIKAGETLLQLGQTIRSSFLILKGCIKVYRESDEGSEFFVYLVKRGEACSLSLVCAMEHKKSKIIARVYTDTTVLSIPLQYIDKWMGKYRGWYQFVIRSYRNRFEELLQTIDTITFSNIDQRLLFYLSRQMSEFGSNLRLTHQEIADDLNSSREVISRSLKRMEAKNLLLLHRNSIELLQPLDMAAL